MSKININRIVRDIKIRSTVLTSIIEAVCNCCQENMEIYLFVKILN